MFFFGGLGRLVFGEARWLAVRTYTFLGDLFRSLDVFDVAFDGVAELVALRGDQLADDEFG